MRQALVIALGLLLVAHVATAQEVTERGFLQGGGLSFPQTAPNDRQQGIADGLFRQEVFLKPAPWVQFGAGLDLRANSYDQVENRWRFDWDDRGVLRPRASLRRLGATVTAGRLTVDAGKLFIRWARADVLNPTDRFAPRDFLNVIDSEFLPVIGVRPSLRLGSETFEAAWTPQLTPSRMPLLDQRWTVLPPELKGVPIQDGGSRFPTRPEYGVRWSHTGARMEAALSYFDGYNHLPVVEVRPLETSPAVELRRNFARIRTYGADTAIPTAVLTFKVEAAYFTSPVDAFDSYWLYVGEVERQTGQWIITLGYAGDVATGSRTLVMFDPERGIARSIIGRASYTIDPRRTVIIEGAARRSGDGEYVRGEFSQATGQHFRLTLTGVFLGGDANDFLGQYKRNSYVSTALRFSF